MGVFDQTARRVAKRDGAGFFRWALPDLDPALTFVGWNDARTAPQAGHKELTLDAVGEFANAVRPEEPWLFVVEFKAEPKGDDVEQLLEYVIRCRRDRRPEAGPRLKYSVGGVLIDLTGKRTADTLNMPVPGLAGAGLSFRCAYRTLAAEDAVTVLAGIASGQTARTVLPWVPLMRGAGTVPVVEEWKRLASTEPRADLWGEYAADARAFADLADVLIQWDPTLREFNMRESKVVLEWQAEAKAETQRADLLLALEVRGRGPVPDDLRKKIETTTDVSKLAAWFRAALSVNSFDEFREAIRE